LDLPRGHYKEKNNPRHRSGEKKKPRVKRGAKYKSVYGLRFTVHVARSPAPGRWRSRLFDGVGGCYAGERNVKEEWIKNRMG
jgi:uncharacterized protein (DUF2147 family)